MAIFEDNESGALDLVVAPVAWSRGATPASRFPTPSSTFPAPVPSGTAPGDDAGLIALDEHTSIGCLIHDITAHGVELTVPDASIVPDIFMLTASCSESAKVCHTLWRSDETIRARFR
ncbi:hypothetical protein [Methylorubrum zatmanii]